jgi:tRNA threonylcarbamoyl adenosine modification protein (Sua5/YciO/YrdC/YwlC family)
MGDPPPPAAIEVAVKALAAGELVAIPTDTVYGLAADPFHTGAADRLFAAKRRPRDVELPVLVADVEQALALAIGVPASARRLMDAFWPGALTIVLPRNPAVSADLGSDEATIGIRCPAHPVPLALCRAAGPLATTSANLHGEATLPTPADIAEQFGALVAVVLDAGPCEGSPSTVVDCTGVEIKLLRQGRIPWEDVLAEAGRVDGAES